jgi:hypothetical protein
VGVASRHLGQYNAEARNSWNWSGPCPGAAGLAGRPRCAAAPGAEPGFIGAPPGVGAAVGRRAIGNRTAGF